ncbi:prevent-host-death protein (plasmid) [Shinella yambaruensis]|uniref:prevent-host-death protein n=1 Tax=Shinella TaxID=323620 RepID=UPI002584ACEB|nr:prevent-host-death protein [Shinella sp.]MCW5712355.1 prevent-host-death protein [Shinella sp.]
MKQFPFSDMNPVSGEILEAALVEPVALTERGKRKLVILTTEAYARLKGPPVVQTYRLKDAPTHIHEELMEGIDVILNGADRDA